MGPVHSAREEKDCGLDHPRGRIVATHGVLNSNLAKGNAQLWRQTLLLSIVTSNIQCYS